MPAETRLSFLEWLGIVCHLAQEKKKHLLSRGCQLLPDSVHLAWRAMGVFVLLPREGKPVHILLASPEVTQLGHCFSLVTKCSESERGSNSNEVASDTTVLHLSALTPTEQRKASFHGKVVFG